MSEKNADSQTNRFKKQTMGGAMRQTARQTHTHRQADKQMSMTDTVRQSFQTDRHSRCHRDINKQTSTDRKTNRQTNGQTVNASRHHDKQIK